MSVPIVGIGASAGGLKSIFELIAGIPASTGMAYVFVQHLDPRHGSDLAKILSKRTAFPVEEVVEGVEISPDHLYVIIPNTTLTSVGAIGLSENRRGKSHPGDAGMRSYDLPDVGKLLEVHDAVSHHLLLGAWKRDRPPSQG
jgi:chemotaxis response regulator CheB